MENLLGNKLFWLLLAAYHCVIPSQTHKSLFRLLCVFLIFPAGVHGQQLFNKVYTLAGSETIACDVAPLGSNGSFVAFAGTIDSLTGQRITRMIRCDASGSILSTRMILHSNYLDTILTYSHISEACKIHDNLFALIAVRFVAGKADQWGNCLITVDSNGVIQKVRELLEPIPGAKDTFSFFGSVRYDGAKNLIIAGHNGSRVSSDPNNQILLMKFDTALHLVWKRSMVPSGTLDRLSILDLFIQKGQYLLMGGADHNYVPWSGFSYRQQSLLIATDTAGAEQWHYASPIKAMVDCEIATNCGIPTQDGGYLYLTTGDIYNLYGSGPAIDPVGTFKLIKLDAARNIVWEKELERYKGSCGIRTDRMTELEDGSIVLAHSYRTDSLAGAIELTDFLFSRYRADGSLVYHRKLTPPRDSGDTSRIFSNWGSVDICRMPDKGFLLGGVYRNGTAGSPTFNSEKAWLIRLDSNGYLAPGDTGSVTVSTSPVKKVDNNVVIAAPNPGNGWYVISFPAASTFPEPCILSVVDLTGRILIKQNIKSSRTEVDLREFPSGVYCYYIEANRELIGAGKLVKE